MDTVHEGLPVFPTSPSPGLRRSKTETDATVRRSRHQRRSSIQRISTTLTRFCPVVSTDELFWDPSAGYLGPYGHIRRHWIDYDNYHKNYRKERQWLQDSIVEDMMDDSYLLHQSFSFSDLEHVLDDTTDDVAAPSATPLDLSNMCVTPTEPWLIFSVGARGAGKKHVLRQLLLDDRLPLIDRSSLPIDRLTLPIDQ